MELKYIEFSFERKEPVSEETGIYVDCCLWLGGMYRTDTMLAATHIVSCTFHFLTTTLEPEVRKFHGGKKIFV